jgi:hypothetical protein
LSMPSTISIAESAMKLAQTCGSVRKSMSMGLECLWEGKRKYGLELIA